MQFINHYRSQRLLKNSDKLFKDVIDYNKQPSLELKRKIDFFFQPYSNTETIEKHMRFGELRNVNDDLEEKQTVERDPKRKIAKKQGRHVSEDKKTTSQAFSLDLINTLRIRQQQPHELKDRVGFLWSDLKERILKFD